MSFISLHLLHWICQYSQISQVKFNFCVHLALTTSLGQSPIVGMSQRYCKTQRVQRTTREETSLDGTGQQMYLLVISAMRVDLYICSWRVTILLFKDFLKNFWNVGSNVVLPVVLSIGDTDVGFCRKHLWCHLQDILYKTRIARKFFSFILIYIYCKICSSLHQLTFNFTTSSY